MQHSHMERVHTPEHIKLHEAHMARRAKWFSAAVSRPVLVIAPPSPVVVEAKAPLIVALKPVNVYALPFWLRPYWACFQTHFNQHVIDYREWQRQAEEDMQEDPSYRRSMMRITMELLEQFPGVTLGDLKGNSRCRAIVYPRQTAMYRIKNERPDLSLPVIGRFFGGRDHTTVLHAVRKIEAMLQEEKA